MMAEPMEVGEEDMESDDNIFEDRESTKDPTLNQNGIQKSIINHLLLSPLITSHHKNGETRSIKYTHG